VSGRVEAYDAWYETPLGKAAHSAELAIVAELVRPVRGERALDVGCGTGIYSAWLASEGLQVDALDRDPDMLAATQQKAPEARCTEGDATALPFADGEFDLVLTVTLLCFLSPRDRVKTVGELVRVTRPGGRVVIGDLAHSSLWAVERRVKAWRGSEMWRPAHFTTARALHRLLRMGGATAISTCHGLYLPPWQLQPLIRHAATIERLGSHCGPFGAAFVAARGERPTSKPSRPAASGYTMKVRAAGG
jgi:ubiquinone/menaquinone biosynthesis C-methylase UbiE